MKTVSPPPPIRRAREVRVSHTTTDARLRELEDTVRWLRFWVSLALTLFVGFATLALVATAYWYSKAQG